MPADKKGRTAAKDGARGSHQGCGHVGKPIKQAGYMFADRFTSQKKACKTRRVHTCMKWMRSIVSTGNGGRPRLPSGACGNTSATSSAHGTTPFISSRNSRLRVRLVVKSNPRLACLIPQSSQPFVYLATQSCMIYADGMDASPRKRAVVEMAKRLWKVELVFAGMCESENAGQPF